MAKSETELIKEAEHLLELTYKEDFFEGAMVTVASKENMHFFEEFVSDINAYTVHMNVNSVAYQRIIENDLIYNGNRINTNAIRNIIDVLRELK